MDGAPLDDSAPTDEVTAEWYPVPKCRPTEKAGNMSPSGVRGEPHEIAGAAVYLASPASTFMTGQAMIVDGGSTIGVGL